MTYPSIKLKKSSVAGRIPSPSDLDYGELAINYTDGKIYYKNSLNNVVGHFVDSDMIDALSRAMFNQEFGFRTTDSLSEGILNLYYTRARSESDITDIVDSAYIQFLQQRYLDSASAINLIDSAYIHSILTGDGQLDLTGSLVVTGNVTSNTNLVSNYSSGDEGGEINLATAVTNNVLNGGHVNIDIYQNRLRFFEAGSPNRGAYIDLSEADTGVAYNLLTGGAGLSQAQVISLIDSPYVQARQIKYDFLDSSEAIHLIDSAYVNARLNRSLFLDSAEAIHLIDVYAFDSTSFNGMFASKSTTNLAEGSNKYYTKGRFDSDFATDFALRTTSNLTEGSNKYYTKGRFDSDFGTKTTSNLTEGSNKYYTKVRSDSDFNAGFALKTTTNLAEGTNKYYTKGRFDSDFATDFALRTTSNLTEGSNKYYTKVRSDSDFGSNFALKTTTNLTEGTNKYYTKGRFDSDFGSKTTSNLTEGTNKYYTMARSDSDAKHAISVTDVNGDGSLSYNSSTGVITYTGPSATEVRAHFSAGLGIKINSGVISLDSADSAVFASVTTTGNAVVGGNLTIDGNFYVGGTTTTITASNLALSDNMIYLNQAILTTISNAVGSGTAVVYTTTTDHNYQIGFTVTITDVTPSAYNLSNQTITAISTNSFTVANSAVGSYVSGGTARAQSSANPDLGFAFGYKDSSYHHGGFFRDATDGYFKVFHQYTPEPDSSVFINTSHASFVLADIQANNFRGALIGNASTATQLANVRTFTVAGDVTASAQNFDGTGNVTLTTDIAAGVIVNADINASAAIVDTKLATISTAGKVSNSATTATDANTASAIVARDASGNFTAGTITAALTGNASTATTLANSQNFSLTGEVTAPTVSFNGSSAVALTTTIATNAVDSSNILALSVSTAKMQANAVTYAKMQTVATANRVLGSTSAGGAVSEVQIATGMIATGAVDSNALGALSVSSAKLQASIPDSKLATISTASKVSNSATTATDANTASAIVARDASGNFTAGTITAALTGNASTATTLQTARTIAISGDVTGTATSFNGGANISISSAITAGSIVSADFNSATSLIIYNSAGTVLKTIYSPGS